METGKIYTFKLGSGEEMIAKVTKFDVNTNTLFVEDPVSVAPGPKGLGLVPSMFTADSGSAVKLNMNCVSIWCLTDDSVRLKYIEAVTGIKVPEKRILVG